MTSCQHPTSPQQHQHIVDSELEPPTYHPQRVTSPLTDTHPYLRRSNIESTYLTSCIDHLHLNIMHLHDTSTCIDSHHTKSSSWHRIHLTSIISSCSLDCRKPFTLHHRIRTDDLYVGSGLSDFLSSNPDCTSVGITGCRQGCRAPTRLDFVGLTRTSTLGMVIHFYSPSFSKFRTRFGASQLGYS